MRNYLSVIAAIVFTGCIDPITLVPDIAGDITAIEVEGQTRTPSVNAATRTVGIEVGPGVDLAAVRVTRIELIETATCDIAAGSVLDLTSPLKVIVTTAAGYEWTITAAKAPASERALPGGSFDEWSSVTGTRTTWNPWPRGPETAEKPEDGEWEVTRWWDTGNKGVTTLSNSNSTPTDPGTGCPANPNGRAAELATIYALLKVAGGNIYFGKFGGLQAMNATVEMGHPWQTKPKGLKGWYKYFPQPIDKVHGSYLGLHPYGFSRDQWIGKMDSLHVSVALWASPDGADIPFTVNTSTSAYVDITRESPGVLAWGSFISGSEQADWKQFEIEMKYFTDAALPANTRLVLQATASKHCNYFIGGTTGGVDKDGKPVGSLMYVDEFELMY